MSDHRPAQLQYGMIFDKGVGVWVLVDQLSEMPRVVLAS
jgi:hypothetical protein